jgi:hypothetical protein
MGVHSSQKDRQDIRECYEGLLTNTIVNFAAQLNPQTKIGCITP